VDLLGKDEQIDPVHPQTFVVQILHELEFFFVAFLKHVAQVAVPEVFLEVLAGFEQGRLDDVFLEEILHLFYLVSLFVEL
jgi:hypothetical protein